jgi:transposase-like protein
MGTRKTYSKQEKEAAVAIYVEHGRKEAESQTGINGKTIAAWTSRAGLATDTDEKRKAAVEASKNARQLQKEQLAVMFGERAVWCLKIMDQDFTEIVVDQKGFEHEITSRPKSADIKNLMVAAATGADKTLLLNGDPTAINETNLLTPDLKALAAQNRRNAEIKASVAANVVGNG